MSSTFQSYDANRDNTISPDEWAQFYPDEGGPPQGDPAAPTEAFDIDTFITKVSSGNFTDDDMLAFSNWYMGQQMGQQAGQMDYQNRYLDHLGQVLEGNNAALAQAGKEMEFQQGPYWDWYVEDFFPHQQEKDRMDFELAGDNLDTQKYLMEGQRYMSDNQKLISDSDRGKAQDYALAQFYGTEQAQYGADAARWQYLKMLEQPQDTSTSRNLGSY